MLAGKIYLRTGDQLVPMNEESYPAEDVGPLEPGRRIPGPPCWRPDAPSGGAALAVDRARGGDSRTQRVVSPDGRLTTCSWIRTGSRHSWRSSEAPIRASAGRSWARCSTMPPNVVAHWPPGELRGRYRHRVGDDRNRDELVREFLGVADEFAVDLFWQSADAEEHGRAPDPDAVRGRHHSARAPADHRVPQRKLRADGGVRSRGSAIRR